MPRIQCADRKEAVARWHMYLLHLGPYAPSAHVLWMRAGHGVPSSCLLPGWAEMRGCCPSSDSGVAVGGRQAALTRPRLPITEREPQGEGPRLARYIPPIIYGAGAQYRSVECVNEGKRERMKKEATDSAASRGTCPGCSGFWKAWFSSQKGKKKHWRDRDAIFL